MLRRYLPDSLTAPCVFLMVLAWPLAALAASEDSGAQAQDEEAADPVAEIQQLNRTGMQYFDDLNYAMAEKMLLQALAMVEKSDLAHGPAGLATNGNLAVLYSAGLRQPDKAVHHFKKALAIKPDLRLSKQRATPETEANLARAKAEMAGGAGPAPGAPTAPAASAENPLSCPTGGEIHQGDEITFNCTTSETLNPANVMLYYKANGAEDYQALQMTKEEASGGITSWTAKVPGAHTQASAVPFFVEANDADGESLAVSGSEDNPSVIVVHGGGVAMGPPPLDGEEEEEEEEEEEYYEIDDANPLAALERDRWREHEGSKGTWLLSLGMGSGLGYASGHSTEAFGKFKVGFSPGFAPATLGHAVWEVAYFVGRQTALSLGGRHQWITGGPPGTATGAHTLLLRSLFFTEEKGKVRWYFACAAGWGEGFRMQVEANVSDEEGNPTGQTVKDTVRGGPFVAGIGGGMLYKLARRWHLTIDTQALAGFTHFSAVFDLTAGARLVF
ncbi:MAG: tetratricopeptide repeat protein [Deltaproteobacteria bacterium]|nr:tetratricopeptide repeat protein [Deltaproteobacteria bacterium]